MAVQSAVPWPGAPPCCRRAVVLVYRGGTAATHPVVPVDPALNGRAP